MPGSIRKRTTFRGKEESESKASDVKPTNNFIEWEQARDTVSWQITDGPIYSCNGLYIRDGEAWQNWTQG